MPQTLGKTAEDTEDFAEERREEFKSGHYPLQRKIQHISAGLNSSRRYAANSFSGPVTLAAKVGFRFCATASFPAKSEAFFMAQA